MDRDEAQDEELKLAKDLQNAHLPNTQPVIEGYSFFDYFQAAKSVDGNYYDYIPLADGRLVVVMADVVGQGLAAAKLMARLSTEARLCLTSESDPAAAVTQLNERVYQFDLINKFVVFLTVTLDPNTHTATIVNAGHLCLIHRQFDGSLSLPGDDEQCLPIGMMEDAEYIAVTLALQPGESLTFCTKGLNPIDRAEGLLFTDDRICKIVAATNGDPTEIGNSVLTQVRQHLGDGPQHDDMCLISFGRQDV